MKTMQSRNSENECPWCREKEWNCYIVSDNFNAKEASLFWSTIVDDPEDKPLYYGNIRLDECLNCGCVVS